MFSSLLLDDSLLQAIETLGFEKMTEVQSAAIPLALTGKDLIVNARTGSGKTLAYVIPMLQQILDNPQSLSQAIILAPTRDLCRQINKQCSLLAQYTDITTAVIIGGEDPKHQIKALEKYPDIIIATPGRLLEHVKRDVIILDAINILLIDEADRMLAMGFSKDVSLISAQCSEECQTILYSASFNQNKFEELIENILFEPEVIMVDSARENNLNIKHKKILSDNNKHKMKVCRFIVNHKYAGITYQKAIIFANKKETVNQIYSDLQANEIAATYIHSDIDQDKRNQLLRSFRKGDINVLIATDVASRGLDIPELDLIINLDVPRNGEDYMHRVGRTGRMFEHGLALTLVNANDWNKMISIENFLQIACPILKIPAIAANFSGPDNLKSSGKSYGKKRKKVTKENKKKKTKIRSRNKKNIGKRRQPSEKTAD